MSDSNFKDRLQLVLERHEGRDKAITCRELAQLLECSDERKIRLLIRDLIAEGLPVASATEPPAGYFVAASHAEAERYAQSIKNRLIEDALRRRDFRRGAALRLAPAEQGRLL